MWTGLPQGLQLHNGRLIVCANHGFGGTSAAPGGTHSHTIYSDTHGLTWHNGQSVSARNSTGGTGTQDNIIESINDKLSSSRKPRNAGSHYPRQAPA